MISFCLETSRYSNYVENWDEAARRNPAPPFRTVKLPDGRIIGVWGHTPAPTQGQKRKSTDPIEGNMPKVLVSKFRNTKL